MRRTAVLALALAGCDRVLGLGPVLTLPDGPPDAPPCVTPTIHDSFDQAPACSSWGHSYGDATGTQVSIANGQLVIQPGPNAPGGQSSGGCASNGVVAFGAGIFLQVTTPPAGYEYMLAAANWSDKTSQTISWSASTIEFSHVTSLGQVPFDATATTWVRIRPLPDGSATVAETSPDGLRWVVFATDPIPPPATIGLNLVAGTFGPQAQPAPVLFDGLNECP